MKGISLLERLSVSPLPVPTGWYAVPLRLIVGLGFIEHGLAKLTRGADGFIAIVHAIGTPFADLFGWATIIVEIVGGTDDSPRRLRPSGRGTYAGLLALCVGGAGPLSLDSHLTARKVDSDTPE